MFDIGWSELLVIGAIALIVVGPKELPGMLRSFGQVVGKARGMAREFQRSMEDAAREVDVSDLRDAQKSMADWNRKIGAGAPRAYAENALKQAVEGGKPAPSVPSAPGPVADGPAASADAEAPPATPAAPPAPVRAADPAPAPAVSPEAPSSARA